MAKLTIWSSGKYKNVEYTLSRPESSCRCWRKIETQKILI